MTRERIAGSAALTVLGVLLALQLGWIARHGERLRPLRAGDLAPSGFSLRGANVPTFGSLTALRGHVVLIDFWAHWCGPCRQSMPHLQALYDAYRARGLEILSINVTDQRDEAKVRKMLEDLKITFPVYYDDGTAQALYQAWSIPRLVLVDKLGRVRGDHLETRPGELRQRIEELLAE